MHARPLHFLPATSSALLNNKKSFNTIQSQNLENDIKSFIKSLQGYSTIINSEGMVVDGGGFLECFFDFLRVS